MADNTNPQGTPHPIRSQDKDHDGAADNPGVAPARGRAKEFGNHQKEHWRGCRIIKAVWDGRKERLTICPRHISPYA